MRSILTGITTIFLAASYRVLPSIISDFSKIDRISELQQSITYNQLPQEFDFIIVGSGSSGSLVANRLSKHFRTLLLEAGGTPFPLQNVPALAPLMIGHKDLDWGYFTTPQKYSSSSLNNKSSYWPRGKGLGGTSLLNFMAWNRGHPLDYDNWANITGDQRWSYEELLPLFKKTENYLGDGDEKYHGSGGDITVSPVSYKPLVRYFLDAARELGYPVSDLNAPFDEAFNEHCFNNVRGQRQSSYEAFLRPIRYQRGDKLTIRKYAYVTRVSVLSLEVLTDDTNFRAFGVEYEQGGRLHKATAKKEIILSAGAIGSPKLLMLSGIGPAEHLEEVGVIRYTPKKRALEQSFLKDGTGVVKKVFKKQFQIKPLLNLKGVGRNLQDHVSALLGPFSFSHSLPQPLTYLPSRDSQPTDALNYLTTGGGPLVQTGSMASGFILSNKSDSQNGRTWPDIQLLLIGLPQDDDGLVTLSKIFNLDVNLAKQYYAPVLNRDSFSIMTVVARPQSRGQILLNSSNPFDYPVIDPKYFGDPSDMKILLKGISKALELVEGSKAFRKIGAQLVKNPFPPCKKHKPRSTSYFECFAREYTISVYHPSGTCAMGREDDDDNSVVDSSLRVKGVKGLRVIDASVMPQIVSSNINPACTVIAERGSSMILKEYLK